MFLLSGSIPASAVVEFQQKYADEILNPLGLKYGTGYVGASTRKKLNALYGCGVVTQPIPVPIPAPEPMPPVCSNIACPSTCKTICPTGTDERGCPFICKCDCPATTNQPPTISGVSGPTTLKISEIGKWEIKASDPEQGILTYQVFWGDELAYASAQPSQPLTYYSQITTFTHSYSNSGIYNPTFTVTDNTGQSAKSSISVNVGTTAAFYYTVEPSGTLTRGQTLYIFWQDY